MAEVGEASAASSAKAAPGLESKSSRGVMGWLRQSSSRRLKSRDASRTPRELQDVGVGHGDEGNRAEDSHSLAAMFKSMPHAETHQADDERAAGGAVAGRRYQRAFSLCDSGPADEHASDLKEEVSKRSIHSDPGDLSDVSVGSTNPHPREGEASNLAEKLRTLKQQAEKKQKPKRTSSASGLSRIGSFITRSFSRGHSKRLKDASETADGAKTGEGAVSSSPALSVIVSAGSCASDSPSSPACMHLESPKLPLFSAAAWLQKFHEQEEATPAALAACHAAADQLTRCLSELDSSMRSVLDASPQRLMKEGEAAKAGKTGGERKEEEDHEHQLAQIRRAMDADGERILLQMQSQEDQVLLSEFLQMMGTVRRLVDTFKLAKKARDALRHDLQGEEQQLHAWEREYGALRESKNFLQDLYNRVCKTRSGLLHNYHEECIRLNQSIQLLRDKIANTVADVFAEFEKPPALETLYGRTFPSYAEQPPTTKSELRIANGAGWRSYQQLVSGHLPPFIMRLKLYAFNSPAHPGANRMRGHEQLASSSDAKAPGQLFSPLRLDECLPRQSCIKSVPPGLALMSSEAEIARYEAQLWGGEEPGDGSWGSFRVFEQWLVDSMKWQWRDAFMYANLRERRGSVQQMIAAKKADIEEAVRLRLKQLWWGRLVEMQSYHTNRAGRLFKKELAQGGGAYALEKVTETDESEQCEEPVFRGMQMNSVDAENALMSAEDARSCVLRVTHNAAFTAFTKALETMCAETRAEFFREQVQRASDLVRQYDDMNEDPGSYEVLERECMQIEAALALLKEEITALEKKRSARQSQLAAKRKNLTQALEKLAAAFDADNKQLAAIEAQWDSAGKVEELVQKWLPTADSLSSSKQQLAEQRADLDAQRAQLEDDRRQLEARKLQQQSSSADFRRPTSSQSSPLSSPRHSSCRDSDVGARAPSASVSHSKSFISRLFGSSTAHPPSPRHPKLAEDELASDSEAVRRHTTVRRESISSEPPSSELPPPLPRAKQERQQQVRSNDEAHKQQLHHQTSSETLAEVQDSGLKRPSPPPSSAEARSSSSSVLYVHLDPDSSPTEAAVTPSFDAREAVNKQQQMGEEGDEHREVEGKVELSRRRAKAKSTAASISRKSQRKKKSMYSKLRSAFSLSKTFHESSVHKGQEASLSPMNQEESALPSEEKAGAHAPPGDADEAVASALPRGPTTEGGWMALGRQSSVLAAIPNIFEVAEEEGLEGHPGHSTSEKDGCSSDAKNSGELISRAQENPKEDADAAEPLSDNGEGESSRGPAALGLTDGEAMGAPSAAFHHQTLADAFRRSFTPRREAAGLARDDRFSPLPSSSGRSITPDPLEKDEHNLTAFGSGQRLLFGKDHFGADLTSPREHVSCVGEDTPTEGEASLVKKTGAAAPIVAFPSLSTGSPAEFRWNRHDVNSSFAAFQEEGSNRSEMKRRRSDSESLPVQPKNTSDHHARGRTPPLSRESGGPPSFLESAASRYVVEDDRIDLFLTNGQADLHAAVIGSCIFSLLDAEERQHCIFLMQNSFVQVPKGCMLVQRGDKVDTLYFVVSGSLGMTEPRAGDYEEDVSRRRNAPSNAGRRRSSYDGEVSQEEFPILLSQGAFVTPRAFVREQQTDHSVVALRPCTLQKLSFHSFQHVLSACIFRRAPQVMHSLGSCPILESLTRRERVQIAALLKWKIYLPEEIVCYQGETCSSLFLVMHGRARALQYVERDGGPDVVDEFAAGDNINAMALLQDAPSPLTLMAAAPDGCVVASLGRQDLQSCLGDADTILSR
ncbi:hypothetical protein Esti_005188 [Eimeria stiedai]